jgi:signal recognition particle receptor subunit beta
LQLDFAARELTIKLVYYGPALSGKTTNLRALHELASKESRGRLMTLDTKDDRTLFFDLLPLHLTSASGLKVRMKLLTVPGQVIHNATRRLVLQGADGVAFIADSRKSETKETAAAFVNLRQNLTDNGIKPGEFPVVIQFNKRDLPEIRPDAELDQLAKQGKEPVFKAIAMNGSGVIETFLGLLTTTWSKLEREHQLKNKFQISGEEVVENFRRQLHVPEGLDVSTGGTKAGGQR